LLSSFPVSLFIRGRADTGISAEESITCVNDRDRRIVTPYGAREDRRPRACADTGIDTHANARTTSRMSRDKNLIRIGNPHRLALTLPMQLSQ
jgi:hypothetical protein